MKLTRSRCAAAVLAAGIVAGGTGAATAKAPTEGTYKGSSTNNPAADNPFYVHEDKIKVKIKHGEIVKFNYRFSGECNQTGPTGGNIYEVFSEPNEHKFVRLKKDGIFYKERSRSSIFGRGVIKIRGQFKKGQRILKGTVRDRNYNESRNLRCNTGRVKWKAKLRS